MTQAVMISTQAKMYEKNIQRNIWGGGGGGGGSS